MQLLDFLAKFPDARKVGGHYMARCPTHSDTTASLAIKERDGKILIHDFGGCEPEQVTAAVGVSWGDLFNDNGASPRYNIRDHSGALLAIHARHDEAGRKSFVWEDSSGSAGLNGTSPADLPLYGAESVSGWDMDAPVVVAEGEKAALALMAAGVQAVGTVCGASSTPSDESLKVLTANDVVLWPDADEAGMAHMRRIGASLKNVAASVRMVKWGEAPPKGDAADVGDAATIRRLVELAQSLPSPLVTLDGFSTAAPPPLLVGRLDPLSHTILYGTGGVGKGTYTSHLLVELVKQNHRPLILDYEHHPEEWARRVFGLDSGALPAIRYAAPLSAHWQGKRGALWEAASELRSLCIDEGITVLVIDSLTIACAGNDVSDPGTPALYAAGLELIERPVLSLAHINRSHDMTYPFGSAFWHNLARVTWSLEEDGAASILSPRKANNYVRSGKIAVEIHWGDAGKPQSISERPYGDTIADRIIEVLGPQHWTAAQITDALNDELEEGQRPTPKNSVEHALREMARGLMARVNREGDKRPWRWSRKMREEDSGP